MAVLDNFISWSKDSYLHLNNSKTQEMCIDFYAQSPTTAPTLINGSALEVVRQYKYLGTALDDKLNFDTNTDYICKKTNQILFFLRKLKEFNVNSSLLKTFYSSFIGSSLTFAMICWFGNLSVTNKNRLFKTENMSQNGTDLNSIGHVYEARATQRAGPFWVPAPTALTTSYQQEGTSLCLV